MLFIGTRKGAFTLKPDSRRRQWRIGGPHFWGNIVNHVVLDPRDPAIRFRMIDEQQSIRRHIKIFVNREQARALDRPLDERDEIVIVGALSGG